MIYTVIRKIILLFALLGIVWFSLAENTSTDDNSCKMKNMLCCKWGVCVSSASCFKWTTTIMKWCSENCTPIIECKETSPEQNNKSKLDEMDDNILKKFNIEKNNETEEWMKIKIKTVKIEKINDAWSKLEWIIQKTESLNYNSFKLKNYVQNFKNIQYYLSQKNISTVETKKYNKELKNIMNNIKQELYNIKNNYKSD